MRDLRPTGRNSDAISLTARMIPRNPGGTPPERATERNHRVPLGAASPAPGETAKPLPISVDADTVAPLRRTPRRSVIVVLPDNYVISPEQLAQRVEGIQETEIEIIIACAGQPADLPALQRTLRHAQLMLAPAGTAVEELRVLALAQATGDIVTVVCGAAPASAAAADRERILS
jgi:hypothetical protein